MKQGQLVWVAVTIIAVVALVVALATYSARSGRGGLHLRTGDDLSAAIAEMAKRSGCNRAVEVTVNKLGVTALFDCDSRLVRHLARDGSMVSNNEGSSAGRATFDTSALAWRNAWHRVAESSHSDASITVTAATSEQAQVHLQEGGRVKPLTTDFRG
ncbi:hypothetical protein [Aestuariimicrobium ganziense]|uniref:hypothetical protein n=1 Tax=Aestuariimicrobium ganziense TaxID=2773677 RepID=UPI001943F3F5|nr:hypothetical protein [Aestuariimicrobium ganziense]